MSYVLGDEVEIDITHIATTGDGVGRAADRNIFVPFTCADEKLLAKIEAVNSKFFRAELVKIMRVSEDRQAAPCEHFEQCGGCTLQHLNDNSYYAFKNNWLKNIIEKLGQPEGVVQDIIKVGKAARRRVECKLSVNKGAVSIGFLAAKSHSLINLNMCPVIEPQLLEFITAFRMLAESLKKPSIMTAIQITLLADGLDIVLTVRTKLKAADREKLINFTKEQPVLRMVEQLEDNSEVIANNAPVMINFRGVEVELPVGAFLQATEAGQNAIIDIILKQMSGDEKLVDLYSGCGTYSFPLAKAIKHVTAYEGSYDMVMTMNNAIKNNGLSDAVSANVRDLFKTPLKAEELKKYDAVVINPPRNGAKPQAEEIAKSGVEKVVMVSCNPTTFERDAACLLAKGYHMTSATAIDQFYWSSHLELVVVFELS